MVPAVRSICTTPETVPEGVYPGMKVTSSTTWVTACPATRVGAGAGSVTIRAWLSTVDVGAGVPKATGVTEGSAAAPGAAGLPHDAAGRPPSVVRPSRASAENTGVVTSRAGSLPSWAWAHTPAPSDPSPRAASMATESSAKVALVAPASFHARPSVLVSTTPELDPPLLTREARVCEPPGLPHTTDTR